MGTIILQIVSLVLAGLLAGEEFIVRYGVQPALRCLDDRSHVNARVALVRRLRVVVPFLMIPTVLAGIAVLVVSGGGDGVGFRWAAVISLVAFVLFSFLGTVPINIKVIEWPAENPPADWRATVLRWERVDVFRSTAAIVAFVCFAIGLAAQVP